MKDMPKRGFSGPGLCRLEAHEVVALLRAGDLDAAELLEASRRRVEVVDAAVNAMPMRCFDRAARQLAAWRGGDGDADANANANANTDAGTNNTGNDANAGAGVRTNANTNANTDIAPGERDAPGWLGGLPIGIKDLNNVAGVPTTFGTYGLRAHVPARSEPLVERLESRGALVVGKTNTPEFGAGGNTFNAVYGATRNPWHTARNAGGSSGGAAASLATGQVWLSHGSDLAGSLRTPAAYCGVVGLRPSPGRAGRPPIQHRRRAGADGAQRDRLRAVPRRHGRLRPSRADFSAAPARVVSRGGGARDAEVAHRLLADARRFRAGGGVD